MTEKFPNLERGKTMQVQEAQRVPIKMNTKRPTPRHSGIKVLSFKDKERILKTAKEESEVTYKGDLIRLAADFSTDILQARREWQKIFQVIKAKACNQDHSTQQDSQLKWKVK